jgi:hypothetical protein
MYEAIPVNRPELNRFLFADFAIALLDKQDKSECLLMDICFEVLVFITLLLIMNGSFLAAYLAPRMAEIGTHLSATMQYCMPENRRSQNALILRILRNTPPETPYPPPSSAG